MMNGPERRTVLRGLAAALALRTTRAYSAAAIRAGEVETSRGDCFARTVSSQHPLAPNAAVFVGDSVGTGVDSSLGLLLGAATKVRLGAETQLRIDQFIVNAGGILNLDRGAILYDHDPKDGSDASAVRSPFGALPSWTELGWPARCTTSHSVMPSATPPPSKEVESGTGGGALAA